MITDRLQEDAIARRVARTEFHKPVVLRAGAGTGKTAALVARVVCWVTGSGWDQSERTLGADASAARVAFRTLSRVVAITFTEAAAAEMAERISLALHMVGSNSAVDGLPVDELHEQAEKRSRLLLQNIDHLQVRTIHAWCRNLLVAHPLEAGLHPGFEVDATGEQTAAVVREVVEAELTHMFAGDLAPVLLALLAKGIQPTHIEDAVRVLVEAGITPDEITEKPFENDQIDSFILRLRDAVTEVLGLVGGAFVGVRAPNATKLTAGLENYRELLEPGASLEALQTALEELLPSNLRGHLHKAWAKGGGGKAESEALESVGPSLGPAARRLGMGIECLMGLDGEGYRLSVRVIRPLLKQVQVRTRALGVIGFTDLLNRASRLMSNPGVADNVRQGVDQLLVDEFQDTDLKQCALIRGIALKGPVEDRPGLFLVGDPKQAIYGWRNADLRAYEGFVNELKAAGAIEHGLIQNFRSFRPILAEVDACMERLMQAEPGLQPAFESLVAARGDGPGTPAVEAWVSWRWDGGAPVVPTKATEAREVEAYALAGDLSRLRAEGVDLGSVGVLFRSMTDLEVYQRALRTAGVPYEVTRDRNYFRRREIVEAAAMLRTLLDPVDTLALVGFLRSGMAAVPDAALMPLWAEDFPSHWLLLDGNPGNTQAAMDAVKRAAQCVRKLHIEVVGLDKVAAWETRLLEIVAVVADLRRDFDELSFDDWVERVRSTLLPEVLASAAYQGAYRVANLEVFFRSVIQQMSESGGDAHLLVRKLRDAIATQLEAEEARPSEDLGAVQLMTIHKAKGLAFEHTYMVDLHHNFRTGGRRTGTWVEPGVGIQLVGLWPPGFESSWSRSADVEEAERIRLIYVAMTRARSRLVWMGAWPEELRGRENPRMLLDLWGERSPRLANPMSLTGRLGPNDDVVVDGIRWVFPGRTMSDLGRQGSEGDSRPSSLRPVAQSVCEQAVEHQSRPWTQGPSASGEDSGEDHGVVEHGDLSRQEAMTVGTAIHMLLEGMPVSGSTGGSLTEAKLATALVACGKGRKPSPKAKRRALSLLSALDGGKLRSRFEASEILGTEVPLLMASGTAGPVGAWVGSIDLLYRCPETNDVVVADYKTDRVGNQDPKVVAEHHRAQGAVYTQAVQAALGLDHPPKFEVWLIEKDARITLG
jgi:ATP-dependent exoDNAse (exonuclease V) beta subunit